MLEQNIKYSRLVAEYLKNSLFQSKFTAEIIADIELSLKDKNTNFISSIVEKNPAILMIRITDLKGSIMVSALGGDASIGNFFADFESNHKTVFSSGITFISTGVSSDQTKLLLITSPIILEQNTVNFVDMIVDLDYYKKNLEKALPKKDDLNDRNIIILDDTGKIVFTVNEPWPTANNSNNYFSDNELFTQAQKDNLFVFENKKIPHINHKVIGASSTVDNYGWIVISATSVNEIFKPLYDVQATLWLGLLTALLFSVALVTFILRKINIIY